jgi:hypothetical protein
MADNMTPEQMLARIAELERKLTNKNNTARVKVSAKGGVSFYGIGRYPVTLYKSQWEILANAMPEIQRFIVENDHLLSQGKDDSKAEGATATA